MDKKDRNYIPPRSGRSSAGSSYGRRVAPRQGYDIDRSQEEMRKKRDAHKRRQAEERLRKKRRMKALRMQILLGVCAAVIIVLIVLFFTPVLDIQGFNVKGNSIVETEEITQRLDKLKGTNLIMLSEKDVKNELADITYIEDISVAKFLIPPSASVTVRECEPVARIEVNDYSIIIDSQLKVLADSDEIDADELAHIDGLAILGYTMGEPIEVAEGDVEKTDILKTCLDTMVSLGMADKLDYIDLTDITNIRFGYDDRIDALCGTRLELERKIRMFDATVTGNNIADNARGIIDLSVTGKAVYTP